MKLCVFSACACMSVSVYSACREATLQTHRFEDTVGLEQLQVVKLYYNQLCHACTDYLVLSYSKGNCRGNFYDRGLYMLIVRGSIANYILFLDHKMKMCTHTVTVV